MNLNEARKRLRELAEQNSDAEARKDISENSARDAVIAEIKTLQAQITRLEEEESLVAVAGGWAIGDKLKIRYKKIVTYGKEKECPPEPSIIILAKSVDITTVNLSDKTIPVAISSPLGRALFNKAHKKFRFDTPVGFCEVEVERELL